MKKIGRTDTGSIIVEMSPAEWEKISKIADAWFESSTDQRLEEFLARNMLLEWRAEFLKKVDELQEFGLSKEVSNIIARAAYLTNGDLVQREAFVDTDGKLLDFDEWCDYILASPDNLIVRGIGEKGKAEILQAIREYRPGHKVEA